MNTCKKATNDIIVSINIFRKSYQVVVFLVIMKLLKSR